MLGTTVDIFEADSAELRQGIRATSQGSPTAFPVARPEYAEFRADPDAVARLWGSRIRRRAARIATSQEERRCLSGLHFDH